MLDQLLKEIERQAGSFIQIGFIFLAIIAISLLSAFLRAALKRKRRAPKELKNTASYASAADPANQMMFVSKVDFATQPLLNKEEFPLFLLIEDVAQSLDSGLRVMAQTSMGEILKPAPNSGTADDRRMAFKSINSKRLDFAVFDPVGQLLLAVEYQGSGHYHKTSFMRDAVKREALRKAGVAFVEVPVNYRRADVKQQLHRALG